MLKLIALFGIVLLFSCVYPEKSFAQTDSIQTTSAKVDKSYLEPMVKYIADNIRYPGEAFFKKIQGNLIFSFISNGEGTMQNAKLLNTGDATANYYGMDKEVIRVINNYKDKQKQIPAGRYYLPVTFILNQADPPALIDTALTKLPNCLFNVVVTAGFMK